MGKKEQQLQPAVTAIEETPSPEKILFTLTVQCVEKGQDLSGIKIDVYSAQKAYHENGYSEYSETLAFTVTTDKNGKAVFERPSKQFSVTVRDDSLPKDFGIAHHTQFFFNSKEWSVTIAKIASVDTKS